jgi:hypothetical protein
MTCCDQCRPLNSARMFRNPAPIFRKSAVQALLKQNAGCEVIEIGAGCLRNALFLLEAGFRVSVLEVPGMEGRFPKNFAKFRSSGGTIAKNLQKKRSFELAVATFVFETICNKNVRSKLLRGVAKSLNKSGCLILSVRGPSDLVTARRSGKRCSDGYLTPGFTFARSYTRDQLIRVLTRNGFRKIHFLHRKNIKSPELLHALCWRRK